MDMKSDFIEYGPITKSKYDELVRQEVLEINSPALKEEICYIDEKIINKITSIYTDPESWTKASHG